MPTYTQLKALFQAWWDLPEADREDWLQHLSPDERLQLAPLVSDCSGPYPWERALPEPSALLMPGEFVGPFQIVRLLGQGGMATVYLAERREQELVQRVALKLLQGGLFAPTWQEQFLRERALLARLHHPHIARLLDFGRHGESLWYAMDYIDGQDLLSATQGASLRQKLEGFLGLLEALGLAHRSLVLHRDIKPGNVLVDREGRWFLLDFGIATPLDQEAVAPAPEASPMTRRYASPEQLAGQALGIASDVYQLGLLLTELCTGTLARAPEQINARALSRDLRAILARALAPDPAERYSSCEAMSQDIRALLDGRPVSARRYRSWELALGLLRRHPLAGALTGLCLLSLIAGVTLSQMHARRAQANAHILIELLGSAVPADYLSQKSPAAAFLHHAAMRINDDFADQPQLGFSASLSLGSGLINLGEDALARQVLEQAARFGQHTDLTDTERCTLQRLQSNVVTDSERQALLANLLQPASHAKSACLSALATVADELKRSLDRATLAQVSTALAAALRQLDAERALSTADAENSFRHLARLYLMQDRSRAALQSAEKAQEIAHTHPAEFSPIRLAETRMLIAEAACASAQWQHCKDALDLAAPVITRHYAPGTTPQADLQKLRDTVDLHP
ncbi:MAG: serine/threonine protein kinase [Xanthomonadales bacterium]|nr:serine/threonine protein kinase [Xanthomonadales bacterium]MCP5476469.1 serine/threonine protein kinase [Rhodanobacteraceae bacterium]